jgi:hypothetical protein
MIASFCSRHLLLHLLQFGLADHGFDACAEMAGNAPDLRDPAARRAQRQRQVLRPDDHDRDDHDQQQLGRADIEHGGFPSPAHGLSVVSHRFASSVA